MNILQRIFSRNDTEGLKRFVEVEYRPMDRVSALNRLLADESTSTETEGMFSRIYNALKNTFLAFESGVEIERYLSQSTSREDLERRIEHLQRIGKL